MALGLGVFLTIFIPQVEDLLEKEISPAKNLKLPSLFLFDIQEDQVKGLEKLLLDKGSSLLDPTPLIRARILKVNGKEFKKEISPEDNSLETRERTRNRFF